ncbi:hypothetical protein E3U43_007834 [Larimichthys crocea]|uniref:Uncharacterized protein n=1 Tax=Larimichthys crocea TaxID=215358 RepID=A0ACD3Q5H6_LARCR|nr:hypothetical protein E3U43_007834 [Larimichthys crocea]
MGIQLKVNGPKGEEIVMDLCDNTEEFKKITVKQLKKKIVRQFGISDEIRLVFRTEPLEDSSLLLSYGIRHMSTIHTLLMLPGGL